MADTLYADSKEFDGACTFDGAVTINSSLTLASTAAPGLPRVLAGAFVLADIEAGTKVFTTLPSNAIVLGCAIRVTTALAFADGGVGDTTNVTVKAGTSGDDDGWAPATALAGSAGYRYPSAGGAMIGAQVAGGSGSFTLTFAASAGTSPDLADVSAGAGTVYLIYTIPASS